MFWKVGGFNAPSPVEQILDKDGYTLEDLLDEDDIIQECKSLNGRLVTFLRERSTVEQLLRYLIDPPLDADDPKRAYKYPFTACEVFCCEVEAVFNTLLEDPELMVLLMSLLDAPAPLSSKTAGYFGRVVGTLLLRKSNEVMHYLQLNPDLIEKLVQHVDTASVAEIIKRVVGAEEPSSMLFLTQYAQWLAETPLVELLLARLAPGSPPEAQSNAADILTAIAHTQPSPLAFKLTSTTSICALFDHALAPGHAVLVPILDVCCALVEPRRAMQPQEQPPALELVARAKVDAVTAIVDHIPKLVTLLATPQDVALYMPYGTLSPPLGRMRLKVVELLAVMLRSGSPDAEHNIIETGATKLCLQMFADFPFNNLLHHCVVALLVAGLTRNSGVMVQHLFEQCSMLEWLIGLPVEVRMQPLPGQEESAAAKQPIRAGYMGHVTQIASTLESFTMTQTAAAEDEQQVSDSGEEPDSARAAGNCETDAGQEQGSGERGCAEPMASSPVSEDDTDGQANSGVASREEVARYLVGHGGWQSYVETVLHPRQDLENTAHWACGRPAAIDPLDVDSDFPDDNLQDMVGMQPVLYHRYSVDNEDDEDDDEDEEQQHNPFRASTFSSPMLNQGMTSLDINSSDPWQDTQERDSAFDFKPQECEQGEGQANPDDAHDDLGTSRPGSETQQAVWDSATPCEGEDDVLIGPDDDGPADDPTGEEGSRPATMS